MRAGVVIAPKISSSLPPLGDSSPRCSLRGSPSGFSPGTQAAQQIAVCAAAHAGTLPGRPPRVAVQLPLRHALRRDDFARYVHTGTSTSDGPPLMAWIDWDAALSALHDGQIPLSGGEQRTLQLASIAEGFPISLRDTLPAWTTGT